MKQIFLHGEQQFKHAHEYIDTLEHGKFCLNVEAIEDKRSQEQNSLIWLIASHFEKYGEPVFNRKLNKSQWYYGFSVMFLDPLLVVDWRDGSVKEVPQGMSKLPKKKFTWVINKIYEFARDHDFFVPSPEDLKYDSHP